MVVVRGEVHRLELRLVQRGDGAFTRTLTLTRALFLAAGRPRGSKVDVLHADLLQLHEARLLGALDETVGVVAHFAPSLHLRPVDGVHVHGSARRGGGGGGAFGREVGGGFGREGGEVDVLHADLLQLHEAFFLGAVDETVGVVAHFAPPFHLRPVDGVHVHGRARAAGGAGGDYHLAAARTRLGCLLVRAAHLASHLAGLLARLTAGGAEGHLAPGPAAAAAEFFSHRARGGRAARTRSPGSRAGPRR